jgi:hypothetical protein
LDYSLEGRGRQGAACPGEGGCNPIPIFGADVCLGLEFNLRVR